MKGKILVVDDDKGITEAFQAVLQSEDYEVKIALSAEGVLKVIEKFKPDLILLDVLLSGRDGREVCLELKKNEQTKKIPVVIVSAHPSAKSSLKSAGADDFLAKPFELDELLSMVTKYVKS